MGLPQQRGINLTRSVVFAELDTNPIGVMIIVVGQGISNAMVSGLGTVTVTMNDARASINYGGVATAVAAGIPAYARVIATTGTTFRVTVLNQAGAAINMNVVRTIIDVKLGPPA